MASCRPSLRADAPRLKLLLQLLGSRMPLAQRARSIASRGVGCGGEAAWAGADGGGDLATAPQPPQYAGVRQSHGGGDATRLPACHVHPQRGSRLPLRHQTARSSRLQPRECHLSVPAPQLSQPPSCPASQLSQAPRCPRPPAVPPASCPRPPAVPQPCAVAGDPLTHAPYPVDCIPHLLLVSPMHSERPRAEHRCRRYAAPAGRLHPPPQHHDGGPNPPSL